MECPKCESVRSLVDNTRDHDAGDGWPLPGFVGVQRFRTCKGCGHRFKTVELRAADVGRIVTPDARRDAHIDALNSAAKELADRAQALRDAKQRQSWGTGS